MNQREDRGGGPDPQRQSQYGSEGKGRGVAQLAERIADILAQLVEPGPAAGFVKALFLKHKISKVEICDPASLDVVVAVFAQAVYLDRQMRSKLFRKVVQPASAKHI